MTDKTKIFNRLWVRAAGSVFMVGAVVCLCFSQASSFFSDAVFANLDLTLKVPRNIEKIEGGDYHTLALTKGGSVYAWGYNYVGQVGVTPLGTENVPVHINFPDEVIDIDAGNSASFAVTEDGTVYGWGHGGSYNLGNGIDYNDRHAPTPVAMPAGVKFEKVSAGGYVAMALTDDGDVYAWGYNVEGQCGDGGLVNEIRVPTKIGGLSNIVEIAMGGHTGAAIDDNGDLYTWGSDSGGGELGDPTSRGQDNPPDKYVAQSLPNVEFKSVSAAYYHMAAIDTAGRVYTWGTNHFGSMGNGTTATAPQETPYATAITNGKYVGGYVNETIVITEDGDFYATGNNNYGELGFGDAVNRSTLEKVAGVSNVETATALLDTTSVYIDGDLYSVGFNGSGQFARGDYINSARGQTHMDGKWIRPTAPATP